MTGTLVTAPNLQDADQFYAAFVTAHAGLSDDASEQLNARLILVLANHIGERSVLDEALELARAPFAPIANGSGIS
jgi:hypothetical protein